VIPFVVILLVSLIRTKKHRDTYFVLSGLVIALLLTGVVTNIIKNRAGRLRPDFLARCEWNGTECTGNPGLIRDGRRSFPSGHASLSFVGLSYLSFYLGGKLMIFDGHGHFWKLAIFFTPFIGATLVALSRVSDYRHFWQDVLCGGILGLFFAYFTYRQYYPSLLSAQAFLPVQFAQISQVNQPNVTKDAGNREGEVVLLDELNVPQQIEDDNEN